MSSLLIRSLSDSSAQAAPYSRCAAVESPVLTGTVYLSNRSPISIPFGAHISEFTFSIRDAEAIDAERKWDEPDAVTWLGNAGHFELLGQIIMLDTTGEGAYFQSGDLTLFLPLGLFPPFSLILSEATQTKFRFQTRSLALSV